MSSLSFSLRLLVALIILYTATSNAIPTAASYRVDFSAKFGITDEMYSGFMPLSLKGFTPSASAPDDATKEGEDTTTQGSRVDRGEEGAMDNDDDDKDGSLFFWLAKKRVQPQQPPPDFINPYEENLIIWLNGG